MNNPLEISTKEFEKKYHGQLLCEEPTMNLRWIIRDDEKVLQQCFIQKYVGNDIGINGYKDVWKDIPIE